MNDLPIQQPTAVVAARWTFLVLVALPAAIVGLVLLAILIFSGVSSATAADRAIAADPVISLATFLVFIGGGLAMFRLLATMVPRIRQLAALLALVVAFLLVAAAVQGASAAIVIWLVVPVAIYWFLFFDEETRKAYRVLKAGYKPTLINLAPAPVTGSAPEAPPIYEVQHLVKHFPVGGNAITGGGAAVQAVSDVTFTIARGETLGVVGESGCGKTTLGRLLVKLIEPTRGKLLFEGHDLSQIWDAEMKRYRMQMQIIFQDPYASLNPRLPIGDIVGEGLYNFGVRRSADRERLVADALERVGLRKYYINRYPHEFSGGQRQRIGIARALVLRPSFVVADEPVSALDVSIQSQVLNLLKDLQSEFNLTFLFISHNLQVVEHVSDRVAVMYLGKLVEIAPAARLYKQPRHPYTQALLSAVPIANPQMRRERILLSGDVPSPINPPSGCRFHTRCPIAQEICSRVEPPLEPKGGDDDHLAACHFAESSEAEKLAAKAAV